MLNNKMQDFVITMLQQQLPATYFYHNHQHTLAVLNNVEIIGKKEGISKKELQLLKAAALWHDTGYINTYHGHEDESCALAIKHLPDFGFEATDIKLICGMIMATMVPQIPHTSLEEIIADADLQYLGTADASAIAHQLFLELSSLNPSFTEKEWNNNQISFLKGHRFFTDYCRQKNEPQKQLYLQQLQRLQKAQQNK